ncbi:hypothetical protein ABMA28_000199 [Loxostege sticticalis]|uniref:Uncharacterized protein n=1 Tax=Loxostege sticticalis TaxID=481309 RepID=A0ABD0TRF7_LOXSC
MPQLNLLSDLSSSLTVFSDKRHDNYDHTKWINIKKFMYLAFTFASSSTNFDIFSKVYENVRLIDFLTCEVTVGMTYLCMDFFIKQYTKRIDFNQNLNPMLKGITYGILLQSALWTMLHASDLADSIRFLGMSLVSEPSYTSCQKINMRNVSCVPPRDVIKRCRGNNFTNFNNTPAHLHYVKSFSSLDQNVLTTRFFASALVWIFNFFCTVANEETLTKIFKMTFIFRFYSTLVVLVLLLCFSQYNIFIYLSQILDIDAPTSFAMAMDHVTYAYGIGFVGVYDLGTLSPYIMVDNAVVIFTVLFTLSAFARSLIIKILYVVVTSCVEVEISITPHYLLFAILPLSSEFFHAHKIYIMYIYLNLMLATIGYLALLTLTMAKLLHSEFRSVKNMYIVGIICFLGFTISLPITVQSMLSRSRVQGLIYGLKVTVLYLGGFKVAIVMWIYGIQRFVTDIQFWLGFKPTKFWIVCWMFLPIVLFSFCANRVYVLVQMKDEDFTMLITAAVWIIFSLAVVGIIHIRTLVSYLLQNNLAKAFSSSSKYGPPDKEDRQQRRMFNETIRLRQCTHNCNVLDDTFDCNHLPLLHKSISVHSAGSSAGSDTKDIYISRHGKMHSSVVDSIEL